MRSRPRRNRKSPALRGITSETQLGPERFVHPLFIHAGSDEVPIASMPGCVRHSPDGLLREAEATLADGIPSIVLFPAEPESSKTPDGAECFNPDGLVQRSVRALKQLSYRNRQTCGDGWVQPGVEAFG